MDFAQMRISAWIEPGEEEPPGVNYFSRLPVEMKLLIFSYLSPYDLVFRAQRVCKEWESLTWYVRLTPWDKYHLCGAREETGITWESVTQLVQRSPGLKELLLMRFSRGGDRILETLAHTTDQLEDLYLDRVTISQESVDLLARSCPNLKRVTLKACHTTCNLLDLTAISQCPLLEVMVIDDPYHNLRLPEEWSGQVKQLDVAGMFIADWDIKNMFRSKLGESLRTVRLNLSCVTCGFTSLLSMFRLESLDIVNCHHQLTDEGLLQFPGWILLNLRQLRLYLTDTKVTSKGMRRFLTSIWQFMPRLEWLDLSWSPIDKKGLKALGKTYPMLRHLTLRHCPKLAPRMLRKYLKGATNLEVLEVIGVPGVTKKVATELEELSPGVKVRF